MAKTLDVIAIGANNMDVIARVDHFPEIDDQVPITSLTYAPGGSSANTAVAAAILGLKVGFLGRVGHDHNGDVLELALKDAGVDVGGLIVDMEQPSGQTFIPVDKNGEKYIYSFPGAPQSLTTADVKGKVTFLRQALFVHLGSLRVIEPLVEAASLAREIDCIVSMNPGPINAARGYKELQPILDNVDVLYVSRRELDRMFGFADMEHNAQTCFNNTDVKLLVVTLGPRGSKYYLQGESSEIEPAFSVPVVNTTGAGDAFNAGFMFKIIKAYKAWLGKIKEKPYKESFLDFLNTMTNTPEFFLDCLKHGNAVAAFVVQGESARENIPTAEMVTDFIKENS
ncbi:MAG TPA: carbohydrate kinase family protein [Candidatus Lokiarchaeia archaeon]|nr:carbohydrate kinase family protein [Candidatus Lokiarchaeia archaeon]